MENTGTVITQCKENIQPLRHGRNASQLGTALRAQEDAEAQQLLQQEKQMYEDAIKDYDGNDPLENWFEYISWIEQSFPKSGHESPLAKLLQQCLTNFEKEQKYHQDQRFIRLWINYISMQKNPIELYQLLYNSGIGTMVADLYRAWAFELEQIEDFKRADEVYMIGLNCRAEPREELDFAHKNFQLAVARKMLGRNDERNEVLLAEQRQAFSSLKAIRTGKKVGTIRTGHRVRDYLPGSVPQQTNASHGPRSNAAIQVYQDEAASEIKGNSILDHVPIEDTVHKENTLKPGPWNNNARKYPLMTSAVRPSFKVHEDNEVIDMEKPRLFPNHVSFFDDSKYYDDYLHVPVFVPDVPNPNIISKPHYPKDLVYADNKDLSMEQIRAQRYLEKNRILRQEQELKQGIEQGQIESDLEQQRLMEQQREAELDRHRQLEQQREAEYERQRLLENQQREAELERQKLLEQKQQREAEAERQKIIKEQQQQREAEIARQKLIEQQQQREAEVERQRLIEQQQQREKEMERQRLLEQQRQREAELERQRLLEQQQQREAEMERQRLMEQQLERQREVERGQELERQHIVSQQSMHSSGFLSHHSSSAVDEQHLLGQSMTVNTKEALSAVQDLWQSPTERIMPSAIGQRMPSENRKFSFNIHMDSSMTQNAMVNNKLPHQQEQQQSFSGSFQPYNDQENNHEYQNSFSNHLQQNSYGNHSQSHLQNSYQYSLQTHHEPHMQTHQHNIQPMMHQMINHEASPHGHGDHHQTSSHGIHHHQSFQQLQYPQQYHQPVEHITQSQGQPITSSSQGSYSSHVIPSSSLHISSPTPMNTSLPINESQQINSSSRMNSVNMNTSQHMSSHQAMNISQHMNTSQHINAPQHLNASQHLSSSRTVNTSHHLNTSHQMNTSQHMAQHRHGPHQHVQSFTQSPPFHQQHQSHQQMYNNSVPNNMGYSQSYIPTMQPAKPVHYSQYPQQQMQEPKMPSYGMPLQHLPVESSEDRIIKQPVTQNENNLYIDESLGITPLPGANETCYTETFNRPLIASTPMTHNFKGFRQQTQYQENFQHPQYQSQIVIPPPPPPPIQNMPPAAETGDKLSVIMESTREYVSGSSGSSGGTRIGITITREDLPTIKEQSTVDDNSFYMNAYNQQRANYEDKMRAQIQAVNAQSPRTVQRGVDQITSDIQTNCDLRKSMIFESGPVPADSTTHDEDDEQVKPDSSMEYEYQHHHEPMEQEAKIEEPVKEEPPFQLPEGDINPFDRSLITGLLRMIKFPLDQHKDGYVKLTTNLIKFMPSTSINLGNDGYDLDKCLGKGTYGTVFKGTDLQTRKVVALKTQKPAWIWEYYIAREIKNRLTNPHMLRGFMDVQSAYVAENGSVLVTEFSKYGTLLAVTNKIKISTGKPLSEPLAIFFTIEMCHIVEYLHKCQIIHADIKPDNFLLMHMPSEDVRPTIQLIDYGCSIDMSLFPEDTRFKQIIKTEDFTCIEMQTGKPWTYQTDLYCLAASSHCLLFGNYMRVSINNDKWYINSKLPRYAKKAVWEQYFTELLNIESCDNLPDLAKLRNILEEALSQIPELQTKYRQFSNVLNRR